MSYDLTTITSIYEGSNGEATKGLYSALGKLGPAGAVAMDAFRATKASARAKAYRGKFVAAAYDKKQWAMDNLCATLTTHAAALGIAWGWGVDTSRTGGDPFVNVLYIELPTGQISFHTRARGIGPDHTQPWDGARRLGPDRVCRFVHQLFWKGSAADGQHERLAG